MTQINRPSRLVVIRHGESLRNQLKRGRTYFPDDADRNLVAGIPDCGVPLTDEGHRQALETGVVLRERYGVPDYVYDSGYRRTIETADGILKAYSPEELARIKRRTNIFLRERDSGYAYDMTEAEARAAFPWLKKYWDTFGGFMARPPGGESLADVVERAYLICNMLFRDRAGQQVFLVTHGGFIRCLRFVLERQTIEQATVSPPEGRPLNCSLTVYEHDASEGRMVLREYNTVLWNKAES